MKYLVETWFDTENDRITGEPIAEFEDFEEARRRAVQEFNAGKLTRVVDIQNGVVEFYP